MTNSVNRDESSGIEFSRRFCAGIETIREKRVNASEFGAKEANRKDGAALIEFLNRYFADAIEICMGMKLIGKSLIAVI